MLNRLTLMNITLVLPDNRILLRRELYRWGTTTFIPWACTVEKYLGAEQPALGEADKVIYDLFKLNVPPENENEFVSVRALERVYTLQGREIIPVIVRTKTHLSFQAEPHQQFKALYFEKFLDQVTELSINPKKGKLPEHTQTCIHVARNLHEKGVFS